MTCGLENCTLCLCLIYAGTKDRKPPRHCSGTKSIHNHLFPDDPKAAQLYRMQFSSITFMFPIISSFWADEDHKCLIGLDRAVTDPS